MLLDMLTALDMGNVMVLFGTHSAFFNTARVFEEVHVHGWLRGIRRTAVPRLLPLLLDTPMLLEMGNVMVMPGKHSVLRLEMGNLMVTLGKHSVLRLEIGNVGTHTVLCWQIVKMRATCELSSVLCCVRLSRGAMLESMQRAIWTAIWNLLLIAPILGCDPSVAGWVASAICGCCLGLACTTSMAAWSIAGTLPLRN